MTNLIGGIAASIAETDLAALDARLGLLEDCGFSHCELSLAQLTVITGGRVNKPRLDQVARLVRKRKLSLTLHAPLALNLMDSEHRDLQLAVGRSSLEIGGELGASVLVVHPGWVEAHRYHAEQDSLRAMEREGLSILANLARAHGLMIGLENMPPGPEFLDGKLENHGLNPASIARQVEAVGHPNLAATLDVSHAAQSAAYFDQDPWEFIAPMASVTAHLHVHDSFARPPTLRSWPAEMNTFGMGDIHLPLGWGDLDFLGLLEDQPIRPGSIMVLEIFGAFADADTMSDCLRRATAIADALGKGTRKRA